MTPHLTETHGLTTHPIWRAWAAMRQRCQNPRHFAFARYGGRGIEVCDRWESFENFRDDMLPTWERGLSLDRIDNDGDYASENCRWATAKQQANNRRAPIKSSGMPLGVSRQNKRHFKATIRLAGRSLFLGSFKTADEAAETYRFARRQVRVYESL